MTSKIYLEFEDLRSIYLLYIANNSLEIESGEELKYLKEIVLNFKNKDFLVENLNKYIMLIEDFFDINSSKVELIKYFNKDQINNKRINQYTVKENEIIKSSPIIKSILFSICFENALKIEDLSRIIFSKKTSKNFDDVLGIFHKKLEKYNDYYLELHNYLINDGNVPFFIFESYCESIKGIVINEKDVIKAINNYDSNDLRSVLLKSKIYIYYGISIEEIKKLYINELKKDAKLMVSFLTELEYSKNYSVNEIENIRLYSLSGLNGFSSLIFGYNVDFKISHEYLMLKLSVIEISAENRAEILKLSIINCLKKEYNQNIKIIDANMNIVCYSESKLIIDNIMLFFKSINKEIDELIIQTDGFNNYDKLNILISKLFFVIKLENQLDIKDGDQKFSKI